MPQHAKKHAGEGQEGKTTAAGAVTTLHMGALPLTSTANTALGSTATATAATVVSPGAQVCVWICCWFLCVFVCLFVCLCLFCVLQMFM
jgi:hypothetical protein